MITDSDWARLVKDGDPTYRSAIIQRERAEAWLAEWESGGYTEFKISPWPGCRVCGNPAVPEGRGIRCGRHLDRNPCAIEGCRRSTSATDSRLSNDRWLCGTHWRRLVPPRSIARRAYNAHFRGAKRYGWTDERREAFWRFWRLLIARARRRATQGHIDEQEINRIMGWDT